MNVACGYSFLHQEDHLSYQTPWVRDLVWLLTPKFNLPVDIEPYKRLTLRVPSPHEQNTLREWLASLDQLEHSVFDSPSRLGLYFENLVTYFLTHNPIQPFRVLEKNHPLYTYSGAGKSTAGELDLLLANQQDEVLHLELAVKFYLRASPTSTRWLGPNARDELAKKLVRMENHQLPLGRRIVQQCGSSLPASSSVYWIKGYLFEPLQSDWSRWSGEAGWIFLSQLSGLLKFINGRCTILEKQYWLGAYCETSLACQTTEKEISNRLTHNNCVMLGLFDNYPLARIMVVNDRWPSSNTNNSPPPPSYEK